MCWDAYCCCGPSLCISIQRVCWCKYWCLPWFDRKPCTRFKVKWLLPWHGPPGELYNSISLPLPLSLSLMLWMHSTCFPLRFAYTQALIRLLNSLLGFAVLLLMITHYLFAVCTNLPWLCSLQSQWGWWGNTEVSVTHLCANWSWDGICKKKQTYVWKQVGWHTAFQSLIF